MTVLNLRRNLTFFENHRLCIKVLPNQFTIAHPIFHYKNLQINAVYGQVWLLSGQITY